MLVALSHHGTYMDDTGMSLRSEQRRLDPLRACWRSISQCICNPLLQDTQQEHSTEHYSMTKKLPNQTPHQRHQADILTVREVSWQVYSRKDQKPEVTYNWKWNPKCKNRKHCMSPRQQTDGEQTHQWEYRGSKTSTHTGHCPHWNATVQKDITQRRLTDKARLARTRNALLHSTLSAMTWKKKEKQTIAYNNIKLPKAERCHDSFLFSRAVM